MYFLFQVLYFLPGMLTMPLVCIMYFLFHVLYFLFQVLYFLLQVLYFLPRILVMPFVCIVYYLWPFAKWFEYWKAPMNKFLADTVSYIIFLILLFISLDPGQSLILQ